MSVAANGPAKSRAALVKAVLADAEQDATVKPLAHYTKCAAPTCPCHSGRREKPSDPERLTDCCSECFSIDVKGAAFVEVDPGRINLQVTDARKRLRFHADRVRVTADV